MTRTIPKSYGLLKKQKNKTPIELCKAACVTRAKAIKMKTRSDPLRPRSSPGSSSSNGLEELPGSLAGLRSRDSWIWCNRSFSTLCGCNAHDRQTRLGVFTQLGPNRTPA